MALAAALRELAALGLISDEGQPKSHPPESPVLLATLLAAEHAVLMVASILPEGEHRRRELAAQAGIAAQARIAVLEATAND